jgi:hypothetical protein
MVEDGFDFGADAFYPFQVIWGNGYGSFNLDQGMIITGLMMLICGCIRGGCLVVRRPV